MTGWRVFEWDLEDLSVARAIPTDFDTRPEAEDYLISGGYAKQDEHGWYSPGMNDEDGWFVPGRYAVLCSISELREHGEGWAQ